MINRSEYKLLYQQLAQASCFQRNPFLVVCEFLLFLAISIFCIYISFFSHSFIIIKIITAIIANIFLISIRFIGHDATHHAIFKTPMLNFVAELIICGIIHGESVLNWRKRHGIHHKYPCIMNIDTGIYINESVKQHSCDRHNNLLFGMQKIYKYLNSAIFYPFMVLGWYPYYRLVSLIYTVKSLIQRESPLKTTIDLACLLLHYLTWIVLLHYAGFGIITGIIIYILFWAISGAWIIAIGAVAHENISPIDIKDEDPETFIKKHFYLLQFIAAQNIKSNWLTRWFYIGLDYHIEHHLFPHICHIYLPRAGKIIKQYARQLNLPYLEYHLFSGIKIAFKQMKAKPQSIEDAFKTQQSKMS